MRILKRLRLHSAIAHPKLQVPRRSLVALSNHPTSSLVKDQVRGFSTLASLTPPSTAFHPLMRVVNTITMVPAVLQEVPVRDTSTMLTLSSLPSATIVSVAASHQLTVLLVAPPLDVKVLFQERTLLC